MLIFDIDVAENTLNMHDICAVIVGTEIKHFLIFEVPCLQLL